MRVVFAGTPQVAVPSLRAIADSAHELVGVITRPDARQGRGRTLHKSPVGEAAESLGVPVLAPRRPSEPDFQQALLDLAPDACPVVAYGALVPPSALSIPTHGWVNLHFSLLPAWRGAAPVQHAIWHGDQVTGATTFRLEEGLDTGPVFGTMTEQIRPTDTSGDLLSRLAEAGAGLLIATLDGIADGSLDAVPQVADGVSLAPKITADDARIRWNTPGFAVDRQIRACTPEPGAWTLFRGDRLKVLQARLLGEAPVADLGTDAAYGTLGVSKKQVAVATARGWIELLRVQPHGKKDMAAPDWARGARIEAGETVE